MRMNWVAVPAREMSPREEEGTCVPACERGYWLHAAPRLTREQVDALSKRERVGWFCRSPPAEAEAAEAEAVEAEGAAVEVRLSGSNALSSYFT